MSWRTQSWHDISEAAAGFDHPRAEFLAQARDIDLDRVAFDRVVEGEQRVFQRRFAQRLVKLGKAKTFKDKLAVFKGFSPADSAK